MSETNYLFEINDRVRGPGLHSDSMPLEGRVLKINIGYLTNSMDVRVAGVGIVRWQLNRVQKLPEENKVIDDKQRSDLDQANAMLNEVFPSQWRGMYVNLIKEGFTEDQAMDLLKTFISAGFGQRK